MADQILATLYEKWAGGQPEKMTRLTPAGSNREYWRLTSGSNTAIGVIGTSADENKAFFSICHHLRLKGNNVPELYAVSKDGSRYLQEDLGDLSLFDALKECRETGQYDHIAMGLLEKTICALPSLQTEGAQGMDFSICYPVESFDLRSVLWDLNYFKYYFLKPSGIEFHEGRLEDDFERLAGILLRDAPYDTFMYRDFQSRNVMIRDGKPWFIDFQGGRRGPLEYDIVSFIWQARAAYPSDLKEHLVNVYIESLRRFRNFNENDFRENLRHFILFRTLQVLGAYGFRGKFERKAHFLASIPAAISNLRDILNTGTGRSEYPYLTDLLTEMTRLPEYNQNLQNSADILTVRITSFSYRKGIPEDTSGNGGGFVFDCRSMHNPGLYDEYKPLDGRDKPVIDFLEAQGEIKKYLDSVYGLTDPAVEKYLKRGFTSLAVNFGCTGGRHRSVRCAESLAAHLHELFGNQIKIILTHREMNSTKEI